MNEVISVPFVSALLVGEFGADFPLVRAVFRKCGWRLFEALDRKCALRHLRRSAVQVVIADSAIDGWNWKQVLDDTRRTAPAPQLVVASREADDYLWSEVLNLGGYDVLPRPFERDELERVVVSARRHYDPQPLRALPVIAVAGAA